MTASAKLRQLDKMKPIDAIAVLTHAFPQIVALAEAAEDVAERVPTIARPIPNALVALKEALG